MLFDTHAHYDSNQFKDDRMEVLAALPQAGVGLVVNPGCDLATSRTAVELSETFPHVYAAVGVHPGDCADWQDSWLSELEQLAREHQKVRAIGEIGLDYYWDKDPDVRLRQQHWFRRQLQLAAEVKLPVIIHSRDAAEDTMKILREFHGQHPEIKNPGVVHCYSYSPEIAEELVAMGWYIGVGGVVTFKNARKLVETVKRISIERILSETDCPYMAPEPFRGRRNDPGYLYRMAERLAELRAEASQRRAKELKGLAAMLRRNPSAASREHRRELDQMRNILSRKKKKEESKK